VNTHSCRDDVNRNVVERRKTCSDENT